MSKKKKSSKEMTIKQKEEMLLQNTIMSTVVMSLVTLIIGCGACAYLRDHPRDGLVEALSGGIQRQGDLVIQNGEVQLEFDAGFGQPGNAILLSQPLGCGLFDDGLAVGNAHQLAV